MSDLPSVWIDPAELRWIAKAPDGYGDFRGQPFDGYVAYRPASEAEALRDALAEAKALLSIIGSPHTDDVQIAVLDKIDAALEGE